jgi:hypothetical protein
MDTVCADEFNMSSEDDAEGEREGTSSKGRKRKARLPGHRRNIKTKWDAIEDMNEDALLAQNEELERMRRLSLQQSLLSRDQSHEQALISENTPTTDCKRYPTLLYTLMIDHAYSPVMVDLTEDDDFDIITINDTDVANKKSSIIIK